MDITSLQESYSIKIEARDADYEPAIYIVPSALGKQQTLILTANNRSGATLYLKDLSSVVDGTNPPTADNCHFVLVFREGVLAANLVAGDSTLSLGPGDWSISAPTPMGSAQNQWVEIYLAMTTTPNPWETGDGNIILLTFENIVAEAAGGTRNTVIQLQPKEVYRDAALTNRVAESSEQVLKVINHLGNPNLPIHAEFVGSNEVLNDGQDHGTGYQLTLRITNASQDDITFDSESKFTFLFEVEEGDSTDKEWALGSLDNVEKITVTYNDNGTPVAVDSDSNITDNQVWDFLPNTISDSKLAPGDYADFIFDLSTFATIHPQGRTYLHFRYLGIPGFWAGEKLVAVEKTPVLINKPSGEEVVHLDTGVRPLSINNTGSLFWDNQETTSNKKFLAEVGFHFYDFYNANIGLSINTWDKNQNDTKERLWLDNEGQIRIVDSTSLNWFKNRQGPADSFNASMFAGTTDDADAKHFLKIRIGGKTDPDAFDALSIIQDGTTTINELLQIKQDALRIQAGGNTYPPFMIRTFRYEFVRDYSPHVELFSSFFGEDAWYRFLAFPEVAPDEDFSIIKDTNVDASNWSASIINLYPNTYSSFLTAANGQHWYQVVSFRADLSNHAGKWRINLDQTQLNSVDGANKIVLDNSEIRATLKGRFPRKMLLPVEETGTPDPLLVTVLFIRKELIETGDDDQNSPIEPQEPRPHPEF